MKKKNRKRITRSRFVFYCFVLFCFVLFSLFKFGFFSFILFVGPNIFLFFTVEGHGALQKTAISDFHSIRTS